MQNIDFKRSIFRQIFLKFNLKTYILSIKMGKLYLIARKIRAKNNNSLLIWMDMRKKITIKNYLFYSISKSIKWSLQVYIKMINKLPQSISPYKLKNKQLPLKLYKLQFKFKTQNMLLVYQLINNIFPPTFKWCIRKLMMSSKNGILKRRKTIFKCKRESKMHHLYSK